MPLSLSSRPVRGAFASRFALGFALSACGGRTSGTSPSAISGSGSAATSGSVSSGTAVGSSGDGETPCASNADCSGGRECAFDVAAGCTATGTCRPVAGGGSCLVEPACTCAGTTDPSPECGLDNTNGPYAHEPIAHDGPCSDDAGAADGSGPADALASDASTSVTDTGPPSDSFPQWWDPACSTSAAGCTDPNCRSANLNVSSTLCAASTSVQAGCVREDSTSIGWACFVRLSDGAVIITMDYPSSLTGLEPCYEAGVTSGPGEPTPQCSDAGSPPSCLPGGPGMTNCGTGGSGTESCCTSLEVTGGTFYRTYANDGGGPTGEAAPASVSSFRLDKYDVTVGRFRQFVSATLPTDGGAGWLPSAGSGKHTHLNAGQGLVNVGAPGDAGVAYETGWVATDDSNVAPTSTNLTCGPAGYATWTPSPDSQESLPITCANWYEAYAFCIWDGGFLPSEAEWKYAAEGGNELREYPWGATAPGTGNQYAIFGYGDSLDDCYYPAAERCTGAVNIAPVGTPALGAGRWGQLDLTGNVNQWNLDWSQYPFVDPCSDCAYLTEDDPNVANRIIQGGDFFAPYWAGSISGNPDFSRAGAGLYWIGFRCARSP